MAALSSAERHFVGYSFLVMHIAGCCLAVQASGSESQAERQNRYHPYIPGAVHTYMGACMAGTLSSAVQHHKSCVTAISDDMRR